MNLPTNKKLLLTLLAVCNLGVILFLSREWVSPTSVNVGSDEFIPGDKPVGVMPPDPESVSRVIVDKKTGREYLSNQLIVEFLPSVGEDVSLRIIQDVGGKMLQRFTLAPLFLVEVKDTGDGAGAVRAIALLSKNPQVKKADFNYLTTLPPETVP